MIRAPPKTQISLGIRPVRSESSLSAWRNLGSLATHWAQRRLIRVSRCPDWSESSLGAQIILLVLSWGGSYITSVLQRGARRWKKEWKTFNSVNSCSKTIDRILVWRNTLIFGPRQANLVPIAYASSEGSGEPAHPRSLARTSAARSYKQWVKRNLQTESRIPSPSEWLGMRS